MVRDMLNFWDDYIAGLIKHYRVLKPDSVHISEDMAIEPPHDRPIWP